jgi:tetratricopeptide (TPR) repeat protein
MRCHPKTSVPFFTLFVFLLACLLVYTENVAAKPKPGKGGGPAFQGNPGRGNSGRENAGSWHSSKGNYGHYHGGSQSRVYVGPSGIGFGYYGRGFGIELGPVDPYWSAPYYNSAPYYYAPAPMYERIEVQQRSRSMIPTNAAAAEYQRRAEDAFRQQQYNQALRFAGHGLVEDPRNGKLHLFVSQILFAIGDYHGAANSIHQGMSLLEQEDWGFVVENFRQIYKGRDYVTQMERLVDDTKEKPNAAYAHFVRGYHYVYLGHTTMARRELAKAVELEPRDEFAAKLLESITSPEPPRPDDEELPAPEPQQSP